MTVSEHVDTLTLGGGACFPHRRTLNNNVTKTLALKVTWISQKLKMVAFIDINCSSNSSVIKSDLSKPARRHFPPPHTTPRCFRIDLNNVSGDTLFHGHSSETELHKPFTIGSLWLMAGPPAKAPGPDRPAEKYPQTDTRHVVIPYCFKWEYSCDKKRRKESFRMWLTSTDLQQRHRRRLCFRFRFFFLESSCQSYG